MPMACISHLLTELKVLWFLVNLWLIFFSEFDQVRLVDRRLGMKQPIVEKISPEESSLEDIFETYYLYRNVVDVVSPAAIELAGKVEPSVAEDDDVPF